ncbi:MAG: small ribosomal subunit Rsm22 family protein [Oligoflexia bacterium]|nr:small ribosomal subunit Rsm22 family protein [Oligoflexia bacterium]
MSEDQLTNSLQKLWPLLALEGGVSEKKSEHYSLDKKLASAYMMYYLPINCLKAALILDELWLTHGMPLSQLNVLDLGCGPATAYWGIAWWAKMRNLKLSYHGWDQSKIFTQLAYESTKHSAFQGNLSFSSEQNSISQLIRKVQPNLILFSNSIGEIAPNHEEKTNLLKQLLEQKNSPYILFIEPGTKQHSRALSNLKDHFLETSPLLPCLSRRPCGALTIASDWCHEEVYIQFPKWIEDLGKKINMKKSAMIFSYLLYGKHSNPLLDGSSRVVSQRLERKGQWECRICTEKGKEFIRVQKSKINEKTDFFPKLGRGDIWLKYTAQEKGDLVEKTLWESQQKSLFEIR